MDLEFRPVYAVAVLAVLLAGGAAYFYTGAGTPTGSSVEKALELSTGSELSVLKVQDRGSLDRVVLSDGSNVIEAYVTDDRKYLVRATQGNRLIQGFVSLRNLTRTLEARNRFISCLDRNNATFYGVVSGNQTFSRYTRSVQLQVQALGGQKAMQIFGGLGPRRVRPLVLNYSRTRGVVWNLNGSLRGGVHTVQVLEQRTTCEYSLS